MECPSGSLVSAQLSQRISQTVLRIPALCVGLDYCAPPPFRLDLGTASKTDPPGKVLA